MRQCQQPGLAVRQAQTLIAKGDIMDHDHSQHRREERNGPPSGGGWDRKTKWAWIGFAVIAAFFLLTEHRAHLLGALPYLLLLACPVLHFFHHRGHGGGHGGHEGAPRDKAEGEGK